MGGHGVVSTAQLVEVTDSAALGGIQVVRSNPVRVINILQHLPSYFIYISPYICMFICTNIVVSVVMVCVLWN